MAAVANMEREVMNTQRILTKKAGFNPDMGLVRYLLDQKPTAFGFAIQDSTGTLPELSIGRDGSPFGMKEVEEFLVNAKDFPALLYFGEGKLATDSIQPIVLYDGEDKPFLAMGIEGDFSKFADAASGQTEEYNFVNTVLLPQILTICEVVDGDPEKILAYLNGESFNKLLLSNIGHRGSLTILGKTGDPIWLGKNELGDQYDWGQTSNEHDYAGYLAQVKAASEKKQQQQINTEAANDKPVGKFSFRGKGASAPPIPQDVATVGEGPRTSVPIVTTNGATTVKDVREPSEPRAYKVPAWIHSNDDIKAWYLLVLGSIPDKWKKRIPVMNPVIDKLPENDIEFLEMRATAKKEALAKPPVVTKQERIAAAPTETSAGAPKSGAEIAAIRKEENTPIIGAKELEAILDIVANVDSQANTKIPTAEIQSVEKKLGAFSTSVGSNWQAMLNWPISTFFQIGNKPKGVAALVQIIAELRGLVRENIKVEDLAGGDVVKTTVTKSGESTVKTESVVVSAAAKEAPKPEKKGFSFRNKAA